MWRVDTFEMMPVELDFSSSGQSRHSTIGIHAAGVCLIKALDLVEFDPAGTQVHVCSCCGFSHCAPGNWVALRRLGEFVVWVPAVAQIEGGEWERQEYSPPGFVSRLGAPLFAPAAWEQLRGLRDGVPKVSELPALSSPEAVRAIQWSAPRRILGVYPAKPQLQREGIVAVTDGDVESEVRVVNEALARFSDGDGPIRMVPLDKVSSRIEFWLDLPGVPGWNLFGRTDAGLVLVLDDELALSAAG